MSKVRAKCANCHKTFKASQKQTLCDDCTRKARVASKTTIVKPLAATAQMTPPKISGPGAAILDPHLARQSSVPAVDGSRRDEAPIQLGSATERVSDHGRVGDHGHASKHDKGHAPAKARGEAKPAREPRTPTPAFEVTDEMRQMIESRYLELAQPEFDGIRSQLAQELGIPKPAVKRVVHELRTRKQLPSWWDLQAYTGTPEDLERIRAAYTPMLPLPAVGVHKRMAADLELAEHVVYQGIRRIRAEMHLPQFNPPEAHATTATAQQPEDTAGATSVGQPNE